MQEKKHGSLTYGFCSLLGLVVVGSEAESLWGKTGTKLLWDEGEWGGVLLPSDLYQELLGRRSLQ